ncbi:phosphohydrolase [Marinicella pacifica]|uniref:Phosphohydrolase n=1 Tax=Marinicella pacifica TaxID=1171543 RepID=A0A917FLH3_9GAMM|nr:HD domain-containing protein [Marinicella pacifica]GGF88076.1 phosphohydrolase [Marinicella pacifica]
MQSQLLSQWENRFEQWLMAQDHADAAHDITHIKRVVKTARQLAKAEGAELAVVIPAAWLHDCVAVAKDDPRRPMASALAAEKAGELLTSWDYTSQYVPAIQHAIEAHSFSADIDCETLEAQIVQDADRMDAIGAIGVARTLTVGTELGHPLTHIKDPFCYHRTPDDRLAMVDHFYTKLLHLKDRFHTDAAKHEAQRRHQFMLDFLKQLESEV